jgi:hypothetical protein
MRTGPLCRAILGKEVLGLGSVVVGSGIERTVRDDVVLQQGIEILDSNLAEEESVDTGAE